MSSTPTGNVILVGRDPFTGIYPVWLTAQGDRPTDGRYSGKLGPGELVQACSNSPEPIQYYIPNVAFFRWDVVSNMKRLLHQQTPVPGLQFSEKDRELWENPDMYGHTNELLITWPDPDRELRPTSIFACPFPALRLGQNDLPFDKVPAFYLAPLSPRLQHMVSNCRRDIRYEYANITTLQFHFYMFLWAHYKLRPYEHVCFGKNFDADDTPPLRQFVIHMPTVINFTEHTGTPFYPNMALATKKWSEITHSSDDPVATNDPFCLLDANITYLFAGRRFPVSGFLLPGDLIGTQNEKFYDAGHLNGYGAAEHASTVQETITAIRDVQRILHLNEPLIDLDMNSPERQPHMPVQMINAWRQRALGPRLPSQAVQPLRQTPPSSEPNTIRPPPPLPSEPHHRPANASTPLLPVLRGARPNRAARGLLSRAAVRWANENASSEEDEEDEAEYEEVPSHVRSLMPQGLFNALPCMRTGEED